MSPIQERFEMCTTQAELMKASVELKREGYDTIEVNKEFSKYRKELLNKVSTVNSVHSVQVPTIPQDKNVSVFFQVQSLGKPVIVIRDGLISI